MGLSSNSTSGGSGGAVAASVSDSDCNELVRFLKDKGLGSIAPQVSEALGVEKIENLQELMKEDLEDPCCAFLKPMQKRILLKLAAECIAHAQSLRDDALSSVATSSAVALGFAPAAPGFSAGGAAGGKRAKDTAPDAAGEAAKRSCGSASGAEGEPAAEGASAAVADAAHVEQPGREEEQIQSQDSRGQEGADEDDYTLLQKKASPAPRSPSTPKSSLPTPTWRESAPSLAVGSARFGGREDEAAGDGFGGVGGVGGCDDPQAGGGFGLVAGGGFVAPARAVSSGRPYSSARRSAEKKDASPADIVMAELWSSTPVNASSTPAASALGAPATGAFVAPAAGAFGATTTTGFGSGLGKRDKARDVCTGALPKRITRRSGHDAQEAALVENMLAGIRAGSAHCIFPEGVDGSVCVHRTFQCAAVSALDIGSRGFITNVGAKMIAPEIQSLVSLDLSSNQIGFEGLESLMRTIVHSTTLKSLALNYNPLGDEGATILGDALKSNRSLTELRIYNCDIGVSGLNALAQGLEVNTKILSLPYFVPRLKTKAMAVTSSARSMTVEELRHELDAWGLDTDGLRDVLLPRMQDVLDRFSTPVASIKKSLARNERIVVEEKLTAFTMGIHARLGATSLVRMLAGVSTPGQDANCPPQFDLLRSISKFVFK